MGAKQSKRSVDISGKEAECAGEVAAAGAGGEGRVEALADVDLKPQLNGDAHIQAEEQTDKEKQLDSGTPENAKDATTEKEEKEQDKEKETTPVTNGESEPKGENGDSTPTPEDGKKPKKEKVKKKWSLRSISFSRKDKPKQEKKQKDEEVKTNGEPEKVPEEAAEATPEAVEAKIAEEDKTELAVKEELTPDTPVTEPITNGSSTPESAKNETPTIEVESSPASPENDRPEAKSETEPEQLPLNGLSIEEKESEVVQNHESKMVEPAETVMTPEIPVKTEVCVEQMPLLESTPPPLPANPPPSSVASFAATTMAPELTDALLANKIEHANLALPAFPDTKAVNLNEISSEPPSKLDTDTCVTFSLVKESSDVKAEEELKAEELVTPDNLVEESDNIVKASVFSSELNQDNEKTNVHTLETTSEIIIETISAEETELIETPVDCETTNNIEPLKVENTEAVAPPKNIENEIVKQTDLNETEAVYSENIVKVDPVIEEPETVATITLESNELNKEIYSNIDNTETLGKKMLLENLDQNKTDKDNDLVELSEDLPPPPAEIFSDDVDNYMSEISDMTENRDNLNEIVNNHESCDTKINGVETESLDGNENEIQQQNLKNVKKDVNAVDTTECNGKAEETVSPPKENDSIECKLLKPAEKEKVTLSDHSLPSEIESILQADTSSNGSLETSSSASKEPINIPQDSIVASDKLSDLIPEVPVVPELKTEMETAKDVAVAN